MPSLPRKLMCHLLTIILLSSFLYHSSTSFVHHHHQRHHHPQHQQHQSSVSSYSERRSTIITRMASQSGQAKQMGHVLFIELGFGADQHGQDATKAATRACRNAIEFNSIPSIKQLVPGGYDQIKLRVQLAIPVDESQVDQEQIRKVFPYGNLLPIEFQRGGMLASSGIAIPEMGDKNDDWLVCIAAVTVGY